MSHIDDGVLHIYLDGELPSIDPSEAEAVEGHLRACPGCRNRLEQARQLRTQAHALLGRSGPAVVREPAFEVLVSRTAERPPRHRVGPGRWRVSAWAASVLLALAVGWYASGRLSDGERLAGTSVPLEVASAPDALPEMEIVPEVEGTPEPESAGRQAPSRVASPREGAAVGAPTEPPLPRASTLATETRSGSREPASDMAARETSRLSTAAAAPAGARPGMPTRAPAAVRAARLRSDPVAAAPDMARVEPSSVAADGPPPPSSAAERTDGGESSRLRREDRGAAYAAAPALPAPPAAPPVGVALEGLVGTSTMAEAGPAPSSPTTPGRWLDETRWSAVDPARAAEHVGGRIRTLPGARVLRAERGEIDGLPAVRTVQRVPGPDGTTVEVEVVQRRLGAADRGRMDRPLAYAPPSAKSDVTPVEGGGEGAPLSAATATVTKGEWILIVRGPVQEEMLRRLVERMP